MPRIALLSEAVASQVAAGEVVERPASVVKELVENSIDAGARKIEVAIRRGGISSIRVVDDGSGMDRDDALLCLERHATSKIRTGADLAAIHTLGFRGEALPSIASVSRFRLATREHGAVAGTEVLVNGAKIESVKDCGDAPGTQIEVRQLFYNLPARRKFLRTENTEASHVAHVLHLQAIGHPEIGFVLVNDERVVHQLPPAADLRARIRDLCGPALAAELLEVPDTTADNIRIRGFLGRAGVSRSSRAQQLVFLNGRPVENSTVSFALREGYHTALMKGQHPVTFLFIEMDPAAVDVNVHPAKREVRFRNAAEVRDAIVEATRRTLESDRESWSRTFHAGGRPGDPLPGPMEPLPGRGQPPETTYPTPDLSKERHSDHSEPDQGRLLLSDSAVQRPDSLFQRPESAVQWPESGVQQPDTGVQRPEDRDPSPDREEQPPDPAFEPLSDGLRSPVEPLRSPDTTLRSPGADPGSLPTPFPAPEGGPGFRILGVLGRLYVLMENETGLVLVDQHAAHERILFEEMLKRMEQQGVPTQRLLLPLTLQVGPRDADWIVRNLEILTRAGIGLEPFGENTFKIDSLPTFLRGSEPSQLLREIIDDLRETSSQSSKLRLGEDMIAKTVCRHAVKANDFLREPELVRLIQDLLACDLPYCCPHGRPTMIQMSYGELEKKFGRKV